MTVIKFSTKQSCHELVIPQYRTMRTIRPIRELLVKFHFNSVPISTSNDGVKMTLSGNKGLIANQMTQFYFSFLALYIPGKNVINVFLLPHFSFCSLGTEIFSRIGVYYRERSFGYSFFKLG